MSTRATRIQRLSEAQWVSCLDCNALPGDPCKTPLEPGQVYHEARLNNLDRLATLAIDDDD